MHSAAAALIAFAAPSALAAPTPSFTVTPASPQSGITATFTSTSTAPDPFTISSIEWDFDGNGSIDATGTPVQHAFPTAGSYTVNMRATSTELLDNQATATATVVVTTRGAHRGLQLQPDVARGQRIGPVRPRTRATPTTSR